jgi:hypothetical protein
MSDPSNRPRTAWRPGYQPVFLGVPTPGPEPETSMREHLSRVEVGHGQAGPWLLPVIDRHVLIVGMTGAGLCRSKIRHGGLTCGFRQLGGTR